MQTTASRPVLLVGCGPTAVAHARVLVDVGVTPIVVGRSAHSARQFEDATGLPPETGGIDAALERFDVVPPAAVVAAPIPDLVPISTSLLDAGVRRLLVEKPVAFERDELKDLADRARRAGASVFAAYNRRFYTSTSVARELLADDGGATSMRFEFTELSQRVEEVVSSETVRRHWFLANSTHVVDLAFHLTGEPARMRCEAGGSLPWHSPARFAGSGSTDAGALFSYSADWTAPGRWGVEVMTPERRLVMAPLEALHVQTRGSFDPAPVALDDDLDRRFKPGFHGQMTAFLDGDEQHLLSIDQQVERFDNVYLPMLEGG